MGWLGEATTTWTVQLAVCGVGKSLFEYRITMSYVPAAVVFPTLRVAFAVPPTAPAGVKLSSVMPLIAGLVIVALVTTPSGSVALTPADVAVPWTVFREAGQLGTMAWLGGPLDGTKATPRKALLDPAVANVVTVPEIVAL